MHERRLLRMLWYVKGLREHDLEPALLEGIYQKYERIDQVPMHYHYPELYLENQSMRKESNNQAEEAKREI